MGADVAKAFTFGRVVDLFVEAFMARLAVALDQLQQRKAQLQDPAWGMTSQKTLPPWIHPDTYVEACRSGAIPGATLWKRQWLAPKEAVLAWVASESREAVANPAEGARHPARPAEPPADAPAPPSPVGGSEGVAASPGTIPGTLRAALAAAVAGGDWATADALLQLLRSADRPPAEVVDLAARRAR